MNLTNEQLQSDTYSDSGAMCSMGWYSNRLREVISSHIAANAELLTAREIVDKYATAARAIHVWLKQFCNESLTYDEMIADAARKADAEIAGLTAENAQLRQWQDRAREAITGLLKEYDSPGDLEDLMYWLRNNLGELRALIGEVQHGSEV